MSSCGKYLIVTPGSGEQNLLYFTDLEKNGPITGKMTLTKIVTKFEADYEVNKIDSNHLFHCINFVHILIWTILFQYITNTGSKAVFRTSKNAPNYRLIVIDFNNFAEANWTTLVEVCFENIQNEMNLN